MKALKIFRMYLAGLDLTVSNLYPKCEYPVSRGTAHLGDLVHWNHSETWRTGLEDKLHALIGVRDLTVSLNSEEFRECVGHKLNDNIVMPTSAFLVSFFFFVITIELIKGTIVEHRLPNYCQHNNNSQGNRL